MPIVLLVDDDPTLRELYTEVLEEMGCTVSTAPDGDVALSLALLLRPDLIITDMRMPRMNGLELCQHLRADERLRCIPRILHSSADRVSVGRGEVFLRKGADLSEFIAQVACSLSSNCREPPLCSAA